MKHTYRTLCILSACILLSAAFFPASAYAEEDFPTRAYGPSYYELSDFYENNGTIQLKVGEKENLSPIMLTSELAGDTYAVGTRNWSSHNPEIASVDSKGVVTAHKLGTSKITVTYHDNLANKIEQTIRVRVVSGIAAPRPQNYFTINEESEIDLQRLLFPSFSPDGGDSIRWSVDKEYTADISPQGIVLAKSYGTCKVTGALTGAAGASTVKTATVKVVAKHVTALKKLAVTLSPGENVDFVRALFPDYNEAGYKHITCSSSNSSVASVGDDNTVTAKKKGECTITVVDSFDGVEEQRLTVRVTVAYNPIPHDLP